MIWLVASASGASARSPDFAFGSGPPWSGSALPDAAPRPFERPAWSDAIAFADPSGGPGPSPEASAVDRRAAGLSDWLSLLVAVSAVTVAELALDPPGDPRWSAENRFDTGITEGLGGGSSSGRDAAGIASDVLLGSLGAALVADWIWLRDELDPWRSAARDGLFFSGNLFGTRVAKVSAGRERPLVDRCRGDRHFSDACDDLGSDRNASFFSGHASSSATLAGLLCARHLNRVDADGSDAAVCATAALAAAATGVLRVTAYSHWGSDVLAGWASGFVFGYWLPTRFEYGRTAAGEPLRLWLQPAVGVRTWGLRLQIRF